MKITTMHSSLSWQTWLILIMISTLVFIMNIDYTAVNLALLPISEEINGDLDTLQWLLSGYVLIWAAFVVPGGRLADLYGKKNILLVGLILFMLGSALTGIGESALFLILGRLLQGLGAALFTAPAYGLVFSSVSSAQQGMAMGIIGGASGLGLAIGPSLAGIIIRQTSWRWLFYINIPLCLVVIAGFLFAIPNEKNDTSVRIDWWSVGLLAGGLGITVFALNQIKVWGLGNWRLMGTTFVGATLMALFWRRDRKQPLQILPPSFLKNKFFMATVAASFLYSYCFALIMIMMSLYLQNTLNLNSSETGLVFLSMTLAMGVLSPIGGKIADRTGVHVPMIAGSILIAVSLMVLSFLTTHSSLWIVCGGLLLGGLGLGMSFPSLNTAMFRTLQVQEINTGSGIFTMAMMIANSLSVIIATSLLVIVGRLNLTFLLKNNDLSLTSAQQEILISVISKVEHTSNQLSEFPPSIVGKLLILVEQSFLQGFKVTLWIGVLCALGSLIVVYRYLRHLPEQKSAPVEGISGLMH